MPKHWPATPAFMPVAAAADDPLAITGFKAWRVREPVSERRYTVIRLESRSGVKGYGEGAHSVATDVAAAKSAIMGHRATDNEFIRTALASHPAMEAAVNNAMLDLVSTSTNVPIYRYLGGPTRFKARVVASLEGASEDDLATSVHRAMQAGFRAFAFPIPSRDIMWRMQAYVDAIRKRFELLKTAAGPETDFVLDAAGTLTPGDAAFIATAFERDHMLWLDEPTDVLTNDTLSRISEESVMPMGLGRHVHDVTTFQNLLRWGDIDILRPSMGMNSIPKIRRMAAVAETHYVAVGPYHNGGPIATVAAIHLAASLPNFYAQQVPLPWAEQDRAMRAELIGSHEQAEEGFAPLINKPGLGVEINEQALTHYSEEVL